MVCKREWSPDSGAKKKGRQLTSLASDCKSPIRKRGKRGEKRKRGKEEKKKKGKKREEEEEEEEEKGEGEGEGVNE